MARTTGSLPDSSQAWLSTWTFSRGVIKVIKAIKVEHCKADKYFGHKGWQKVDNKKVENFFTIQFSSNNKKFLSY